MNSRLEARAFDRKLFLAAAVLFPLIVLVGFGRTYYARGLFEAPPIPSMLVHVHGLVMSAWVLLFVTQIRLIARSRVGLHQRLGYAGVGLALILLATGIPTALRLGKYGSASAPPDVPSLSFMLVPMMDLVLFVVFFGAAVAWRRQPATHKRLMLLTALNFLPPAVARIPSASLQALGPLWFFGLPTALALLCLGIDTWRNGRVNRAFLAGTLLLIASYPARLVLMGTQAWLDFATWATRFV